MLPHPYRRALSRLFITAAACALIACCSTQSQKATSSDSIKSPASPTSKDTDKTDEEMKDDSSGRHLRVKIDDEQISAGGRSVVSLEQGEVPADAKRGGEAGMVIKPLLAALREVQKQRSRDETDPLVLDVASTTSHRLLLEVIYTAREAGFDAFRLRWSGGDDEAPSSASFHVRPADFQIERGEGEEVPLALVVTVAEDGFWISATGATLPPERGCPETGPTLCLVDEAYDFRGLYNKLVEIKSHFPEETSVTLSAGSEIPAELVGRAAKTLKTRLPEASYAEPGAYRRAVKSGAGEQALFPHVALAFSFRPDLEEAKIDVKNLGINKISQDQTGVILGELVVTGRLDKQTVREKLEEPQSEIRYCFEHVLSQTPDLSGKLTVAFAILPSGRVSSSEVKKSTLNNQQMASCVLSKVRRWSFPRPEAGIVLVKATYAFRADEETGE